VRGLQTVADPDLEQRGNTDVVVRGDPVRRYDPLVPCRTVPRSISNVLVDACPVAGKPARTVLRALGGPQGPPGYSMMWRVLLPMRPAAADPAPTSISALRRHPKAGPNSRTNLQRTLAPAPNSRVASVKSG
jgi:hypothetical protein